VDKIDLIHHFQLGDMSSFSELYKLYSRPALGTAYLIAGNKSLAEYLGIPHIANVLKIIEIKDKSIIVEMDMANTIEIAEIQFPCLLTVEKDIFQPRLPSYRRKLITKDREIKIITLNDFEDKDEKKYGLNGSPTQVERIFPPDVNNDRETWTGSGEELSLKIASKLKQLKFV